MDRRCFLGFAGGYKGWYGLTVIGPNASIAGGLAN